MQKGFHALAIIAAIQLRNQLFAKDCIAASRVAAKPCTGSRPSLKGRSIDHTHGLFRRALTSEMRPTICPSAITSYCVGLPVGCNSRSVIAATNPLSNPRRTAGRYHPK